MNDLWSDISDRLNILDESIKNLRQSGREYAEAEAAYNLEVINASKLRIKVLEAQLNREWRG